MKWTVTIAGRSVAVDMPDIIADGQIIDASVAGKPVRLVWHKTAQAFALVDENGVERQVQLRARQVTRFEGESEAKVSAELRIGGRQGIRYAQLSVEPYVPGQQSRKAQKGAQGQVVRSQITGKVLKVFVKPGDKVESGQALLIIEAMKMENRIFAQAGGSVQTVAVKEGDAVATGKELVRIAQ